MKRIWLRSAALAISAVLFSSCALKDPPIPSGEDPAAAPSASKSEPAGGESVPSSDPAVPAPSSKPAEPSPSSQADPPPSGADDETAGRGTDLPIAPFERENIAARPVLAAALGECFYFVSVEGAAGDTPFTIEKFDATGRMARASALPNLGKALRLKTAGENLVILGRSSILLVDPQTLEVLLDIPVPQAVRASLDAGGAEYDVAEDLSVILYAEKGDGAASSALLDIDTGDILPLGLGDSVRRIIGPDKKLLGHGSGGSVLYDTDGKNPRGVGVEVDMARAGGRYYLVQGDSGRDGGAEDNPNGVYDFEAERFYPIPAEAWPDQGAEPLRAGIGGGRLFSVGANGSVYRTDWLTGDSIQTGARPAAGGQRKSIAAVSDLGVILYAAADGATGETALYLHVLQQSGAVLQGATVPPLPFAIARGAGTLADGTDIVLRLEMTSGHYWDKTAPGYLPGAGIYETNYAGIYHIVVEDAQGRLLYSQPLEEGGDSLNFSGAFDIQLDDYNQDGDPDFTIGQWRDSNGNLFDMFTIRRGGRVEKLDGARFTLQSDAFSVLPKKISPLSFEAEAYDRESGRVVRYIYAWEEDSFYSTLSPEDQALRAAEED